MKTRAAKVLDAASLSRLLSALDWYAERESVVGSRTRAFAYLMADGALRSGSAVYLDIDEVVRDPKSGRIEVLDKVTLRPCEGTQYKPRTFATSEGARAAIADYLEAAKKAGWLAERNPLKGPLFIASYPVGKQQRLSQRTAIQAWHAFLAATPDLDPDCQMDDLVLTGRTRFAAEVGGNPELLSEHAGISITAATRYGDHLSQPGSTSDVLARLDSKDKHRPVPAAPRPPEAAPDIVDQIRKLADLRDAKILSEKEFQAKKRELLARI
jgi:hypothetical protein